jgi:hypothetical protein
MVRAELREAGIEAIGMESFRDMNEAVARGAAPSLVVVEGEELGNEAARKVLGNLARTAPILVVNSRTELAPELPGAEVLWRPVRVRDIVSRVLVRLGRGTA